MTQNSIREKIKIDWNGPIQAAIVAAVILGANLPFFFLNRSEIASLKTSTEQTIASIRLDMKQFHEEFINETKDFHGRLCKIEAERK